MTQLRELTEPGRREVKRTLDDGNRVTEIDDSTIRDYSSPIQDETADLDGLREELDRIANEDELTSYEAEKGIELSKYDHRIDAAAAEPIRQYLDFSRRIAARDGLWHWLAVGVYPDFIYYRWRESGAIEEKFLGAGTNIYSNALHRLWWGAELTRENGNYERTRQLFEQGELANDVLDRWFARFQPATHGVVDNWRGEDSKVVSDLTRDFRNELSSYTLELMIDGEIETLLERVEDDYTLSP